ncbi:MAG TPA: hypothetical protein VMT24_18410 [Aggregatilineaceae bacterium]|nr:hypothetical protein [Aggregatilineaceae bacterium]
MSLILTRLPGEPIIVVKPALPVEQNIEHVFTIDARCDQIVSELGGPLYRILDMRLADLAFSDILLFLDLEKEGRPGSLADPRVRTLMVGRHPLLKIAARRILQELNVTVPVFEAVDEALACVRADAEARSGSASCGI